MNEKKTTRTVAGTTLLTPVTTTARPLFDPEKYYTISVFLFNATNADNCRALQYTNQRAESLERFRDLVYKNGISYKDPKKGSIELIPPHNIQTIIILPQTAKDAAALPDLAPPIAAE